MRRRRHIPGHDHDRSRYDREVTVRSWAPIAILAVAASVAFAGPPRGYRCGRGGYARRGECKCPLEKMPARDADDRAICAPKPEPAPTACFADRKGKQRVKIDSSPTGATLYLGDRTCGVVARTPWSGSVQAGPMVVILELNGYDPLVRTLAVAGGSSAELFVPLQRIEIGGIEVRADADPQVAGAPISVDGQPQGAVPATVKLRAGRHLVEIAKPGFEPFTEWVTIEEGRTLALLPTLHAVVVAKARIVIDADVPQAEVFFDGTRRGTTPIAINDLPLGVHDVEVRKAGAQTWKRSLMLPAGTTLVRAELAASLPKNPDHAILHITSKPSTAEVSIDGTVAGLTPLAPQLAPGDHWIQVRSPGYVTFEQKLALSAGESKTITATLVRAGRIKVTSVPAGATVFVDGVRRGTSPLELELPAGAHTVIVERAGYQRFERKVELGGATKVVEIAVTLRP